MERWKATHNSDYHVSSLGRVRRATDGVGGAQAGRILKPMSDRNGRLYVRFDRPQRRHYIHHLVLEAFTGPRQEGMECNHKDGDPQNNQADNLEWVTRGENLRHAVENGHLTLGERNGQAKLTEVQVVEIRERSARGETQTAIARDFGISKTLCSMIVRGERWAHAEGAEPGPKFLRGERNPRTKLTESDVREIRKLAGRVRQKEIAARFGVSTRQVSDIVTRRAWDHLE